MLNSSPFSAMLHSISQVEAICRRAKPHLRSLTYCVTTEHTKEHYAFQLYTNFLIATICQEVLQKAARSDNNLDQVEILTTARRALISAAESFLCLHRLSIIPLRTWSALHCGIGTALLLGMLAQLNDSEDVVSLLRALVDVLPDSRTSPDLASLSLQHQRALHVLKMRRQGTSNLDKTSERSRPLSPATRGDGTVDHDVNVPDSGTMDGLGGSWYTEK